VRFLDNIRIGRKLLMVFGVLVSIMVASTATTYMQVRSADQAADSVARVSGILKSIDKMEASAIDQLQAVRGLLLTGDRANIDTYRRRAADMDALLDDVRQQVRDNPKTFELVESYGAIVADWRKTAERQIDLMRRPLTVDQARAIESNGAGSNFLRAIKQKYTLISILGGKVVAENYAQQKQAFSVLQIVAAVGSIVGVLLALVGYLLLNRGISRPIVALTSTMGEISNGNYDAQVGNIGRGDEVGDMAGALEVFRRKLIENRQLQAEADARQGAELDRAERIRAFAQSFEADAGKMTAIVSAAAEKLENTAESLKGLAETSSQRATMVSGSSEETSNSVDTVASATSELSSSIAEISRQMSSANELATETQRQATQTQGDMRGLAEDVDRIGTVVNLIREIAEQTNLLALNATIESARAGEAGKGFAVVANEVKTLASQTGKATEEIASQIAGVQSRTQVAVSANEKIAEKVADVLQVAGAVASATEQQYAATNEISRNVEEVAKASRDVNVNIVEVRASAEQTGKASADVLTTARDLARQADGLKSLVNRFLEDVRAA
jgi:methyl-accepting chemotaxis protein